jgi:hypothetical protein
MAEYEKLGTFYLRRGYDLEKPASAMRTSSTVRRI